MIGNRGVDGDLGWINRRFQAIQRQIDSLRSERRAEATTVGDGGLRIDGGELVALDADGSILFRIGTLDLGDRGTVAYRDNGTIALEVRKLVDAAYVGQSVAIYDAGGKRVFMTEDLLGGLRAPYLEHPFQPVAPSTGTAVTCGPYGWERVTTSTSFQTLFVYDGKRQNPFLDLKVAAVCSDATTAGEVQIVNLATGLPLDDFFNPDPWLGQIPAGTTSYLVIDPSPTRAVAADGIAAHAYMRLGIQVRRTAGAGSITLAVPQAIGG
jgi:hypothetical protein